MGCHRIDSDLRMCKIRKMLAKVQGTNLTLSFSKRAFFLQSDLPCPRWENRKVGTRPIF
jgi:hypothetical protein